MENNNDIFDLLHEFPTGAQLFPFKMYNTWDEFYTEINRPESDKPNKFRRLGDIQKAVRTPTWKSASIVYLKYKRSYDLNSDTIEELVKYLEIFKSKRLEQNKKCTDNFLTQEASKYIKENFQKKIIDC